MARNNPLAGKGFNKLGSEIDCRDTTEKCGHIRQHQRPLVIERLAAP